MLRENKFLVILKLYYKFKPRKTQGTKRVYNENCNSVVIKDTTLIKARLIVTANNLHERLP